MSVRLVCMIGLVALIAGCTKNTEEASILNPDIAASRGYDAFNQGDYQEARAHFEAALAVDPENSYALLGMETIGDDLWVGASRTVRTPSAATRAFDANLRGHDAYEKGDLSGAERHFLSALDAEPDNAYALLGLGLVYELAGETDAAGQFYDYARLSGAAEKSGTYAAVTRQRQETEQITALAIKGLERLALLEPGPAAPTSHVDAGSAAPAALYTDVTDAVAPVEEIFIAAGTVQTPPVTNPSPDMQEAYQTVGSYEDYVAAQIDTPESGIALALGTTTNDDPDSGSLVYSVAGSSIDLGRLEPETPGTGQVVFSVAE